MAEVKTREGEPEIVLVHVRVISLDGARKALLFDVVETYFRLSPSESERYRQLVLRKEIQMGDTELSPLTWAGEIELEAKQDMLLKSLTKKFGRFQMERSRNCRLSS